MLTISKTQMEILRQAMRAEFIRTTAAMLRKAVPNFLARLDEATALARVEACVAKAESYGLSTERDIRDFIAVQTVAGESFDTDPPFCGRLGGPHRDHPAAHHSVGTDTGACRCRAGTRAPHVSGVLFPDLGGDDRPHDATVMTCPTSTTNWIDLAYLYEDGTGVPGAAYVVQRPHGGEPGGAVLAKGVLDSAGQAHVPLPLGIEQVEVYFHQDPAGTPYEDEEAVRAAQEPDPDFLHRLWNGTCAAADWVGGVLAGDFTEDASTSQIVVNTMLIMIPGLDQLGDARGIIANLKKLLWDRRWGEGAVWLAVLLCLIGLIPTLGSLAKGIVRVALRESSKLADLLAVFNFFKKGNGVHWLREFAQQLPTDHAAAATQQLTEFLDRAMAYLRRARDGWFTPRYLRQPIERLLENIRAVKTLAPQKLREAATEVSKRITQAMNAGLSRGMPGRTKRKVTLRQKAEAVRNVPLGHTEPTGSLGGMPSGKRTNIPDKADRATKRSVEAENASADQLANAGYKIEQNPKVLDNKNPDYLIEGKRFDCKAPETARPRNVWSEMKDAVDEGQADRIVLNLEASPIQLDAMKQQ